MANLDDVRLVFNTPMTKDDRNYVARMETLNRLEWDDLNLADQRRLKALLLGINKATNGSSQPMCLTHSEIAHNSRFSVSTVRRALRDAVSRNLVLKQMHTLGSEHGYCLNWTTIFDSRLMDL